MSLNSAIKSRLVRCPRCRLILPEPHNFTVYKCGGCGTILQTKNNKRMPHRRGFTSVHFFWRTFGLFDKISKSKGCKLLECQQRALALCLVVMEAGSILLDIFGKNAEPFLLVAFLLSAFSLALNLYVSIKDGTKTQAERQKKMNETVAFLLLLVVETIIHFHFSVVHMIFYFKVMGFSGFTKNQKNAAEYFVALSLKILLKVDLWITDVPPVKRQTIDSKPSTSNQIDLEPLNSLTMRSNAGTDVEQANRQVNNHDIPSHNIEENDNNDYYKSYIEHIFNSTEYVDMLPEEELEKQLETEKDNKNGGGGDDNGGGDGDGDGDNNGGGGDDGNNGSGGGKNEKKDNSDGNGDDNNDKGEGNGSGSSNNGNMKRKQNKPMFGCKFGYHAGNENWCPIGQLQCI